MITRRAALTTISVGVAGCATLAGWLSNPAIAAGLQDAIDVAVGVIFPALGANAVAIANETLAALAALISLLSGGSAATTTIATLGTDAVNAINADTALNADVKLALTNVVGFAAATLATETAAISPTASGPLVTLFTDIQSVLQLFVGGASSTAGRAVLLRAGVRL
jgi:hypothetical protein